ncbi:hypothetical protein TNIN_10361 [Trichonephila inaurata madagascariensis]|uniref:Uncharacterized protein n=1 Tax=Trichonephila inaurata madagascariensis TaxID=2747483 RepID=A0A8X7CS56_9ARAC|nr:hypothetical protein TNIN_10361 [Trichonephila inaurata madagascariensis]
MHCTDRGSSVLVGMEVFLLTDSESNHSVTNDTDYLPHDPEVNDFQHKTWRLPSKRQLLLPLTPICNRNHGLDGHPYLERRVAPIKSKTLHWRRLPSA